MVTLYGITPYTLSLSLQGNTEKMMLPIKGKRLTIASGIFIFVECPKNFKHVLAH